MKIVRVEFAQPVQLPPPYGRNERVQVLPSPRMPDAQLDFSPEIPAVRIRSAKQGVAWEAVVVVGPGTVLTPAPSVEKPKGSA